MSSRLLKVANSAFFGLSGKVDTLDRAIVLLGNQFIQALAMSISVVDVFSYSQDVGRVPWNEYWFHSFACGWVCQRLVREGFITEMGDEAFLSGLLHDIGKPILWNCEPIAYQEVIKRTREASLTTYEAESAILGFDHSQVGGYLGERWRFPQAIVDAIREHHETQPITPSARLVQVSDWVTHNAWFSDGLNPTNSAHFMSPVPVGDLGLCILTEVGKELVGRNNEIQALVQLLSS
jgi:HD-like signal output (HDOD) protein